jgi:hypothetical protein
MVAEAAARAMAQIRSLVPSMEQRVVGYHRCFHYFFSELASSRTPRKEMFERLNARRRVPSFKPSFGGFDNPRTVLTRTSFVLSP